MQTQLETPHRRRSTKRRHCVQATNPDQGSFEPNFIQAYKDLTAACNSRLASHRLFYELVPCLTRLWHDHESFPLIRKWCRDLCRRPCHRRSTLPTSTCHVLLRCFAASVSIWLSCAYLAPSRRNIATDPVPSASDYDCRTAINTFFAPDRILPAPGSHPHLSAHARARQVRAQRCASRRARQGASVRGHGQDKIAPRIR